MASTVKFLSVYRMALKAYISKTDGLGSLKYGGRWTPKGFRSIYTSQTRSLSFYEFMANHNVVDLPESLFSLEIKIPKEVKIQRIDIKALPKNWRKPFSKECRDIGRKWLIDGGCSVLMVPSSGFEEEYNYILNPEHKEFKRLKFMRPVHFSLDDRISSQIKKVRQKASTGFKK